MSFLTYSERKSCVLLAEVKATLVLLSLQHVVMGLAFWSEPVMLRWS